MKNKNGTRPVPPGEILNQDFEAARAVRNALEKTIGAPPNQITVILSKW